jgi:2'-5' RNA ligase
VRESIRAFVALPLPEEAKDALWRFVERKKSAYPQGKWVSKDHFHLTLAFFPALPSPCVEDIRGILEHLGGAFPSYSVVLEEVGVFPSWQRARVLWIGLDGEGKTATIRVARALFQKLREARISWDEGKDFVPHVTLARFRSPLALCATALAGWSPFPVVFREIALFQSTLTPSGPVYQKLVQVPLKG